MAEKVLRDRGYRSDSIAISRDMGPPSPSQRPPCTWARLGLLGFFPSFTAIFGRKSG